MAASGLKKSDQKYLDKMMEDMLLGGMGGGMEDMMGGMDEETMMEMMMGGDVSMDKMFGGMPGMGGQKPKPKDQEGWETDSDEEIKTKTGK